MSISKDLLDILACPKCKGEKKTENGVEQTDLEYNESGKTLTCHNCRLKYRIENDIPVMLIDEAESF